MYHVRWHLKSRGSLEASPAGDAGAVRDVVHGVERLLERQPPLGAHRKAGPYTHPPFQLNLSRFLVGFGLLHSSAISAQSGPFLGWGFCP